MASQRRVFKTKLKSRLPHKSCVVNSKHEGQKITVYGLCSPPTCGSHDAVHMSTVMSSVT